MAYNIKKYNGVQLTVIADGTLDSTLSLKLVGKNYAGYGEAQNENFVYLLENFAKGSPPDKPITGQLWFDSSSNRLKFYDSAQHWRITGGADISAIKPTWLPEGEFWFDTANRQLWVWSSTGVEGGPGFVLVGPQSADVTAATAMVSATLYDTTGSAHSVIEAIVNGKVNFIISTDTTFRINNAVNQIDGFTLVYPGITLIHTHETRLETTDPTTRFYGTSTNSDRLAGRPSTYFAPTDAPTFTNTSKFADAGYTIGTRFAVSNDTTTSTIFKNNLLSGTIKFQTTSGSIGSSAVNTPLVISGTSLFPEVDGTIDLGTTAKKFKNVYATSITSTTGTFSGKLTISGSNDATTGEGQLYLNGNGGNRIDFNNIGVAVPSKTAISIGTKILLAPFVDTSTNLDYAIGIENSAFWQSIPVSTNSFKWYAGTAVTTGLANEIATLSGTGALRLDAGITATTGAFSDTLTISSTGADDVTFGKAQIYLKGSGSRIDFEAGSPAAPTKTVKSIGTRLVFGNQVGTSPDLDYAIGIESGGLWQSVANDAGHFRWYAGTAGTAGAATEIAELSGTGALTLVAGINAPTGTFSDKLVISGPNNATNGEAQIYLNGSYGNRIDFNNIGVAKPASSHTARSVGTKILLFSTNIQYQLDYAFGIESGGLWQSIPLSTNSFKWYADTTLDTSQYTPTLIATLSGTGALTLADRLVITGPNTATNGEAQIYLNGSYGNRIDFSNAGMATPTLTTRSSGTRLLLQPGVSGVTANPYQLDAAIGVSSAGLWNSVPNAGHTFSWWSGSSDLASAVGPFAPKSIATLSGSGALTLVAGITALTGTFSDKLVISGSNNVAFGEGQIYLSGTDGNRIDFNGAGVAKPAITTRSAGTRIVLVPVVGANADLDYAIGIEPGGIWQSVQNSNAHFSWYAGSTTGQANSIATLSGTGALTLDSTITATNIGTNAGGTKWIQTAAPVNTLGVDGDIWYRYIA